MATVNFIYSTQAAGAAQRQPVSFGTFSNTHGWQDLGIYMRHDYGSDLFNCAFYIQPYSGGGYVGLSGEGPDYLELLDWGTWSTRGVRINQDAGATDAAYNITFSTATGAASTNAIPLATIAFTSASSTGVGHFPTADEAHYTLRVYPPPTATSAGVRQFSFTMKFDT